MTPQPDFKGALEHINSSLAQLTSEEIAEVDYARFAAFIHASQLPVIKRALLIADKLMQEPSESMIYAGDDAHENQNAGNYYREGFSAAEVFKAMIQQALKEIV